MSVQEQLHCFQNQKDNQEVKAGIRERSKLRPLPLSVPLKFISHYLLLQKEFEVTYKWGKCELQLLQKVL